MTTPTRSAERPSSLRAVDAAGSALALVLVLVTTHALGAAIVSYDEGIVLTGAHLIRRGQAPYRDFYANYPPGIFLLVAGIWSVGGVQVIGVRVLGLAVRLALAGVGGLLAARIGGRRFSPLAAALVLDGLLPTEAVPYAYLVALALLLAAGAAGLRGRWLAAGALFGAVGCFRHDLFVYASLLALPAVALAGGRGGFARDGALRGALARFAVGALAPLIAVWLPALLRAGLAQPFHDLFLDQVRYVVPARALPLPRSLQLSPVHGAFAFVSLPGRFPVSCLLTLGAPLCAGVGVAFARRWHLERRALLVLGVSAGAVLPQLLNRSDAIHAAYTVTPALVLAAALLERFARRFRPAAWALAACALLGAAGWARDPRARLPSFDAARSVAHAAPVPSHDAAARRRVVDFVTAHSRPGDPLFVGCGDHRRVILDDVDLYFLADRPGATRIMQFDPDIVTRAEVQRAMIAELERSRPPVVVLRAAGCWWPEPNRSSTMGAALLDDYLRRRYADALDADPFRVLTRRAQ
ncbi:MAG: hypothetical protein IT293_11005 [Deltaproteobacteria bacterium]|nr:hypothetical protein [Deltaproteobacteria bacterium]